MRALHLRLVLLLIFALAWQGCPGSVGETSSDATPPAAASAASAAETSTPATPRARRGRPLPAYHGLDLDGAPVNLSSWVGQRTLIFFFNPEVPEAVTAARAVASIAGERADQNFQIQGVAQGAPSAAAKHFLAAHALDIPTLADQGGGLSRRIGLRSPVALVVVDAEGSIIGGSDYIPKQGQDPAGIIESQLRQWLRLPEPDSLEDHPMAPLFEADRLEGGKRFKLADLRGRPVVLIFFLHTCPHCHEALGFLKQALQKIPESARPTLIGVSVVDRVIAVRQRLKEDGLDFFPVLLDGDASIRSAYGAMLGVPVLLLIDAQGRIVSRTVGWRSKRDPSLMSMRLAKLSGQRVPMLLHKTGYSGNEFCVVCHEDQQHTWELTNHATAFDTLVRHGADQKDECVSCHTVGYGHPGGYSLDQPSPALENVGCESCHGRGGPHLSPQFVTNHDYQHVCVTCHNPTHSLGFNYATFLPKISHVANQHLTGLSAKEKRALLTRRHRPRKGLLPTTAHYVGSAACQSCHAAEHGTWAGQAHAHAGTALLAKGKGGDPSCLGCHTTGYGLPGGFPKGGALAKHPALAAVGCESCHGPGGEHVKPDAPKRGTILSLGDKCDTCVVLQICGSCHDDANDPGFEFKVQDKIEKQRHGTIAAGTGKPLGPEAALRGATRIALLERAFSKRRESP